VTLSWSRHQYVEFVFDQKVETWLRLHRNALAFFGGVPRRLVIDNLKAAIIQAIWDDPEVQQSYRECAEHYGFLIAPCRPRTPEHKGKVEQGGVHYVKRNGSTELAEVFLGGREPTTITQANQDVLVWCNTTAGLRPLLPAKTGCLCQGKAFLSYWPGSVITAEQTNLRPLDRQLV
jgi:transposase